jgi:hypothetical protein
MFADWANRGVNLWTIEPVTLDMVVGTNSYNLNSYDIDIISAVLRTTTAGVSTDVELTRIGRTEYLNIPNKDNSGRPVQFFLDRQTTPVLKVWPTPDITSQVVTYNIQRIDDVSTSTENPDVPSRFIPCMVSGLAYNIALKKNPEKAGLLKQVYEEQFSLAADEDRSRVSLNLVPARSYY